MSIRHCIVQFMATAAILITPICSYGAAQLRAGAKTSAQPTSTNPQQRQIQITFDPDVIPVEGGGTDNATYNVTSFQLSVKFDPSKVQVLSQNDVQLFGPFVPPLTFESPGFATPALGTAPSFIDNTSGVVSGIGGQTPVSQSSPGDVNIFTVTFTLLGSTTLDDLLTFTIFADPRRTDIPDSITGTDPLTGNTLTSFARDITPTTIASSFNGFAAQIAAAGGGGAAPLPTGFWAGAILLGLLAMAAKVRGSSVLAR